MQSSFSFSDIKIIALPTGSSIYSVSHLATAKSIFVRKERFSALKNHSKVNAPVQFCYTRYNLYTNNFCFLALIKVKLRKFSSWER